MANHDCANAQVVASLASRTLKNAAAGREWYPALAGLVQNVRVAGWRQSKSGSVFAKSTLAPFRPAGIN